MFCYHPIVAAVAEGNLEVLLQNDQLKEQIKFDRAFSDFQAWLKFATILQYPTVHRALC